MLPVADPEMTARAVKDFLAIPIDWYFHMALRTHQHQRVSLSGIKVPAVFIAAKYDLLAGPKDMLSAAERLAESTYVELPRQPLHPDGEARHRPGRTDGLPGATAVIVRSRLAALITPVLVSRARSRAAGRLHVRRGRPARQSPLPTDAPTGAAKTAAPSNRPPADRDPKVVRTIASGLAVPWGLAFLPDGSALVTERDSGRVLSIRDGEVNEVGTVPEAAPMGEAGLLGVAVSPSFAEDHEVFLYVTTDSDNRIMRTTYDGERLGELDVILDGIPNDFIHDGGRLAFGPDGYLYASTGETGDGDLAQDRSSLGGKILRITTDGDPAPGNPFKDSPIWTWGHRNVQGLAFDDNDRLWASEFGASDWDELNLIIKGANYGWPFVEGTGGNGKYAEPLVVWRTSEASPSGLAFRMVTCGWPRSTANGCGGSTSTAPTPATRPTSSSASTGGCARWSSPPTATCG